MIAHGTCGHYLPTGARGCPTCSLASVRRQMSAGEQLGLLLGRRVEVTARERIKAKWLALRAGKREG